MDGKTHKALNSSKYPEIKFQFTKGNTVNVSGQKSNLKGDLIIAGQKKEVDMIFSIVGENQNQITVKGEVPLKMSDFGIEPPTAMMGTLKTGDEVLIKYELTLQKTQKIN
jgi:polyisoprenoid-binding protein YceI